MVLPLPAPVYRALARAEVLNLRSYLRLGRGDTLFAVAAVTILVFAFAILHEGVAAVAALPTVKPWAAVAWGAACVQTAWLKPGGAGVLRLQDGVFQPWLGGGMTLKSWSALRAVVIAAMVVAVTTVVLAFVRLADVLPFIALALLGIAAGAALCFRLYSYNVVVRPRRPARPRLAWRFPATPAWTLLSHRLRRRAILPVWLFALVVWTLGAAIAGLAAHNNHNPGIGFVILSVAALISGGLIASPDLAVVRLAARQPISVHRLLILFCALPLILTLVLTLGAGLAAGLGSAMAAGAAAFATLTLATWLILLIPHAMMRSPRGAVGLAAGDLVLTLLIKAAALFGLLAVAYLVVRIVVNLRAAARLRWREAG